MTNHRIIIVPDSPFFYFYVRFANGGWYRVHGHSPSLARLVCWLIDHDMITAQQLDQLCKFPQVHSNPIIDTQWFCLEDK